MQHVSFGRPTNKYALINHPNQTQSANHQLYGLHGLKQGQRQGPSAASLSTQTLESATVLCVWKERN